MNTLPFVTALIEAVLMDGKPHTRMEIEDSTGMDIDIALTLMWQQGKVDFDDADATYTMRTEHLAALEMLRDGNL
jgi:hypothetical protein